MIFDHLDHGELDVLLLLRESVVDVLLELLGECGDDRVRVVDLLAVQFDEGELAPFGTKLALVVNVLQEETNC